MPSFLACYDLRDTNPSPHGQFKEEARALGWSTIIRSDSGKYYGLPNTTLRGDFVSRDAAVAALKATKARTEVALRTKIFMDRWIVVGYDGATFDSDFNYDPA